MPGNGLDLGFSLIWCPSDPVPLVFLPLAHMTLCCRDYIRCDASNTVKGAANREMLLAELPLHREALLRSNMWCAELSNCHRELGGPPLVRHEVRGDSLALVNSGLVVPRMGRQSTNRMSSALLVWILSMRTWSMAYDLHVLLSFILREWNMYLHCDRSIYLTSVMTLLLVHLFQN